MSGVVHREVERKYDVDEAVAVPELAGARGVALVHEPVEHHLRALYFDTPDLALARHRITLRRRSGGDDEGWHLKLPTADGARLERREPLTGDRLEVPEPLLPWVRVYVRDSPLVPVVSLATRRVVRRLADSQGVVLGELCDDTVTSHPGSPGDATSDGVPESRWREWEVELAGDDLSLLDAVEPLLLSVGARPASGPSKLARALGPLLPPAPPSTDELSPASPARDVLGAYLGTQIDDLESRDPLVRHDAPDSVHKMRVATRRLRSALRTFRPLLDRSEADRLRAELAWLADALGGARDAEVQRERLTALVETEPIELVVGPVVRRIEIELSGEDAQSEAQLVEAMESERYFRLLDALDRLRDDPPWSGKAGQPAGDVLPKRVHWTWKRLRADARRAQDGVTDSGPANAVHPSQHPSPHDEALHEVRKSAKKARYAAEALAPVFGSDASRFASAAEATQEALGEHHDSVVLRDRLRTIAVQAHLAGENAFTYGRLHAHEERRGEDAERAFRTAWKRLRDKELRRWLRG